MSQVLRCVVCDCRAVDDVLLDTVSRELSDGRRKYSESFAQPSDRMMRVMAGYCMESLAGSLDTKVMKLPNGKPVFERDDMHLSISHSGGFVAIAWSDMPIGVDLQRIVPMGRIADRILSERERDTISDRSDRSLVKVWTKKESYVKMTGEGMSKGFDTFDDSVLDPGYGFHTIDVDDDTVLSVCGRSDVGLYYDVVTVGSIEDIHGAIHHQDLYE